MKYTVCLYLSGMKSSCSSRCSQPRNHIPTVLHGINPKTIFKKLIISSMVSKTKTITTTQRQKKTRTGKKEIWEKVLGFLFPPFGFSYWRKDSRLLRNSWIMLLKNAVKSYMKQLNCVVRVRLEGKTTVGCCVRDVLRHICLYLTQSLKQETLQDHREQTHTGKMLNYHFTC